MCVFAPHTLLLIRYISFDVRFGSRSARIFRLLLRKRHLEQKQVEDFAMIPAKEAKDMLYTLLSQNLVQLQVCGCKWGLKKELDSVHTAGKVYYYFSCYKGCTPRL